MSIKHYDLIVVGTGFSSSFFLRGYYSRAENKKKRALVLEAGRHTTHQELLENRTWLPKEAPNKYTTNNPQKPWWFSTAFGGSSNCWYGTTPRMLPEDFRINSLYGIGRDWPISYDDLEKYYVQAEQIMDIAGSEMPYPMSRPYPLPPHHFSTIDTLLKQHYPSEFFHLPTARSSITNQRAQCCNNGVCFLCPINSKFTILNGMSNQYSDNPIEVLYESFVSRLHIKQNIAHTVEFVLKGKTYKAKSDLVILGANAIFNPFILLKSDLDDGIVGTGICEQVGASILATFDNRENTHGSTITTGIGYNYAKGEIRKHQAAMIYQTVNRAKNISLEKGKWLNQFEIIFAIEDLPQVNNRVSINSTDEFRPLITYNKHSDYAQITYEMLPDLVSKLLNPLDVIQIDKPKFRDSESHIQCTTVMGTDPSNSVVDESCKHHRVRNLVVLGSSCFPTASPANPTITLSALSLYAAAKL